MFEKSPEALWVTRPSLRMISIKLIPSIGLLFVVWVLSPHWVRSLYMAYPDLGFWSVEVLQSLQWIIKGATVLWVLVHAIEFLRIWSTRYELTATRFLYHHGLLVRSHDEIELHRIRDFRVISPLFSRLFGLSKIYMVTRDETFPELIIGPFINGRELQSDIRDRVEAHKKAVGFREFESH